MVQGHRKTPDCYHSAARLSDGTAIAGGDTSYGKCNLPALPPAIAYAEVAAGHHHTLARYVQAP